MHNDAHLFTGVVQSIQLHYWEMYDVFIVKRLGARFGYYVIVKSAHFSSQKFITISLTIKDWRQCIQNEKPTKHANNKEKKRQKSYCRKTVSVERTRLVIS